MVQSTDKNFLVPVGGSVVFAQKNEILEKSMNFINFKYLRIIQVEPAEDLF